MCASFIAPFACAAAPKNNQKPVSDLRPVSSLSVGDYILGTVASVGGANSAWIDIGVGTITGKPVRGRLKLGDKAPPKKGAILPVTVHRLNVPAARVEVRRNVASTLLPLTRRLEDLEVGERIRGKIIKFAAVGAVVDVGVCRAGRHGRRVRCTGLLRSMWFEPNWASPLDVVRKEGARVLALGDELDLFVRTPKPASAELMLSAIEVTPESVAAEYREKAKVQRKKRRRRPASSLIVGEERAGVVRNVEYYGAFVDVGVKNDGLIHFHDMGPYARYWREIVERDTKVNTRIKVVDGERINLELTNVVGHEIEEERVNPALVRPDSRKTTADGTQQVVSDSAGQANPEKVTVESSDTQGKEEKEEATGFDKFTDDYFEDKYL